MGRKPDGSLMDYLLEGAAEEGRLLWAEYEKAVRAAWAAHDLGLIWGCCEDDDREEDEGAE